MFVRCVFVVDKAEMLSAVMEPAVALLLVVLLLPVFCRITMHSGP